MKADFYRHLQAARKLRGLSQKELVGWLRSDAPYLFEGLDVNGLSRWETGKVSPSAERMVRVLWVLEYSVDELKLCHLPNKAQSMARILSLQEIEINGSSSTYFANADYVLGKWLTVLSWRESSLPR